jgi:hypothetical protein
LVKTPGLIRACARSRVAHHWSAGITKQPLDIDKSIGRFDSSAEDATFVVTGTYFGRRRFEVTDARDGLTMRFRGWSYGLEDYARALEQAGFLIEIIREPVPDTRAPHLLRWRRVPLFLHIRAVRA